MDAGGPSALARGGASAPPRAAPARASGAQGARGPGPQRAHLRGRRLRLLVAPRQDDGGGGVGVVPAQGRGGRDWSLRCLGTGHRAARALRRRRRRGRACAGQQAKQSGALSPCRRRAQGSGCKGAHLPLLAGAASPRATHMSVWSSSNMSANVSRVEAMTCTPQRSAHSSCWSRQHSAISFGACARGGGGAGSRGGGARERGPRKRAVRRRAVASGVRGAARSLAGQLAPARSRDASECGGRAQSQRRGRLAGSTCACARQSRQVQQRREPRSRACASQPAGGLTR